MESRDFSEGFAAVKKKTATARREAKRLPLSGFAAVKNGKCA